MELILYITTSIVFISILLRMWYLKNLYAQAFNKLRRILKTQSEELKSEKEKAYYFEQQCIEYRENACIERAKYLDEFNKETK